MREKLQLVRAKTVVLANFVVVFERTLLAPSGAGLAEESLALCIIPPHSVVWIDASKSFEDVRQYPSHSGIAAKGRTLRTMLRILCLSFCLTEE